jgi:transcriptional regulator with XRE-family HTH domain
MFNFKIKHLANNSTLGEKLKKLREAQGFDLASLAKITGINPIYLLALEEGRYQNLPSYVYTTNYLKSYLFVLGVNQPNYYLKLLQSERMIYQKPDFYSQPIIFLKLKKYFSQTEITPQKIRLLLVITLIFICFGYLGWETKKIISPPMLLVESPQNNLITNKQVVEVRGRTAREAKLLINEQEVFVGSDGVFSDKIFLQEGLNIIKISAQKRYSKVNEIFRKVLVIGSDEKKQEVSVK